MSDDSQLEYEVGFPVYQDDLGLWRNGKKMIDGDDYTFNQANNSVIMDSVEEGDELHFRVFKDL